MAKRYITLPNGNRCGLPIYVKAWRTLKAARPDEQIKGWGHFATDAKSILRDIRCGVHDRINKHIPNYGNGRKWESQWQKDVRQTAGDVNTPRLIVRWVPRDLKNRLDHRLHED